MTLLPRFLIAAACAALLPAGGAAATPKVLRYAFPVAETAIDPARVNDLYSRTLTQHIFEGLYHYDHLARPIEIRPLTAAAMPEVSDDFKVWTVRLKPGTYFADDPAFRGKPRELVAQDYVYAFKRIADPANRSPAWSELQGINLLGLAELRQAALDGVRPFDYDREIPGLQAIDRYTVRFRLAEPRPRLLELLAGGDLYGAVARDVIEFYGDAAQDHPVGTGPFKLATWRRSAFIALERNPQFREMHYDAHPAADDAEGQALLARLKGRRLPMVDRVEISIIEEGQPRWLAFLQGAADVAFEVSSQFAPLAMPNGRVAPNLAKQGIRGYLVEEPSSSQLVFNLDDPAVGGMAPQNVALRRAIGLGMNTATEIAYAYNGMATKAQTPLLPFTRSFDPTYRSDFSRYDPARANALLDLYGWRRGADGWRTRPDGSPLLLVLSTQSDLTSHRVAEVMDRNMNALGLRLQTVVHQWPENLKAARAGSFMLWVVGSAADAPDSIGALARYDSRQIGGQNMARFRLPAFDALYDRIQALPDGPERNGLFRQAENLAVAYMPYKFKWDYLAVDLAWPQVVGYRHPVFWNDWWQYVDIDATARTAP